MFSYTLTSLNYLCKQSLILTVVFDYIVKCRKQDSAKPNTNNEDTTKIYRKLSRSRRPFEHERSLHGLPGRSYDVHTSGMYHRYRYISKLHGHSSDAVSNLN